MNTSPPNTNHPAMSAATLSALQDRFAMKLASRLSDAAQDLPYDIAERLRAARVQALAVRKSVKTAAVATPSKAAFDLTLAGVGASVGGGLLGGSFGADEGAPWWSRLASALPLLLLVVGLITINTLQNDFRADELAEVDAALLTDDLPPAAYTDPGFAQFLKSGSDRPL